MGRRGGRATESRRSDAAQDARAAGARRCRKIAGLAFESEIPEEGEDEGLFRVAVEKQPVERLDGSRLHLRGELLEQGGVSGATPRHDKLISRGRRGPAGDRP